VEDIKLRLAMPLCSVSRNILLKYDLGPSGEG
jgi:hypothetical protein